MYIENFFEDDLEKVSVKPAVPVGRSNVCKPWDIYVYQETNSKFKTACRFGSNKAHYA